MAASNICEKLFNLFGKIRLEGIDFKNWVGTDTSSNDKWLITREYRNRELS